jgi:hypothetical protein
MENENDRPIVLPLVQDRPIAGALAPATHQVLHIFFAPSGEVAQGTRRETQNDRRNIWDSAEVGRHATRTIHCETGWRFREVRKFEGSPRDSPAKEKNKCYAQLQYHQL